MHFIVVTDMAFLPMEINEISSAFITRSVELTVEIDLRRRVNLLLELIFIRDRTFTV